MKTKTQLSVSDTIEKEQSDNYSKPTMIQESSKARGAICTLFEGNYHYGLAALVNSLYLKGFEGDIYAGYRGLLPDWAKKAQTNGTLSWEGAVTLKLNNSISIHFLPLVTNYHLTNYKPDFMLELWVGPAKGVNQLFYFDPDIVVDANWTFFTDWVSHGVALCEDINSPLFKNHPRRKAWRKYFAEYGFLLKFKEPTYANGGFVGLNVENRTFLEVWRDLQEKMAYKIGGLEVSQFSKIKDGLQMLTDPNSPFSKTDQDALNATVESWDGDVSFIGKDGMGFKHGRVIMPHAIGGSKPWSRNALKMAFLGNPPRIVDNSYWRYANGIIPLYSPTQILRKKTAHKIAALIGRFYKRS